MIGAIVTFGVMAAIGYGLAWFITKHEEARAKYEREEAYRLRSEIHRLHAESEPYPREWE